MSEFGREYEGKSTLTAYKGFDKNLQCQEHQYEIGKTYTHKDEVQVCASGYHVCEYPLDVFQYYGPADSRYAIVDASGEISRSDDDSKFACSILTLTTEIGLAELANRAVEYVVNNLNRTVEQTLVPEPHFVAAKTGDRSEATNSEYRSVSANTGDYAAALNAGVRSAASATGSCSAASNSGHRSVSANTGERSVSANSGVYSVAANTGDYSASASQGDRSVAANTGDRSATVSAGHRSVSVGTGDYSASVNSGYLSLAANTGSDSVSTNTGAFSAAMTVGDHSETVASGDFSSAVSIGYCSSATSTRPHSVAASFGSYGCARASAGGAIVLCYRDVKGHLVHIRASKVGENGIAPDTWYTLNARGEFVEVKEVNE